jgi:predicted outer membrane protein
MWQKFVMMALALSVLAVGKADGNATSVASLLDRANSINSEELRMAKTAQEKARDSQPLRAFADILKTDLQANEGALIALSRRKNVKIEDTRGFADEHISVLENMHDGQFSETFLNDEINSNRTALDYFIQAKRQFSEDPEVELYIGRTIPILGTHLEMAKNLQRAMIREKLLSSLLLLGYD